MAKKTKKSNALWIIKITLIAFIISIVLSYGSEALIPRLNLTLGILVLLIFISIGVLFDMIGVAITSADEEPFHAKSSRKVTGANTAVKLLKNAEKVSSFCNDVVGDICGILSGSAGIIIASGIIDKLNTNAFITTLIVTALIASLTIGLKAIGKSIALKHNIAIIINFSKLISIVYR